MEKSTGKPHKPTVAVVKFASCDGCQLTLLNCEEELLALADRIEFAHFAEASSDLRPGPYDLAIVEGSISTPKDLHRIVELRAQSKKLITIGACATAGGVQALRNFADHEDFKKAVYASPEMIDSLAESSPIAQHVQVDFNSSKSFWPWPAADAPKPPPNASANPANGAAPSASLWPRKKPASDRSPKPVAERYARPTTEVATHALDPHRKPTCKPSPKVFC
jgi:Ni,Fe-hydrogenase III small subunit